VRAIVTQDIRVAAETRRAGKETGVEPDQRPMSFIDLPVGPRRRCNAKQCGLGLWAGTTLTVKKEYVMKMHLIMAAALTALSSHAAFARYDGGDTWSELEPSPITGSSQSFQASTSASLSAPQLARYDGGDTWSELQAKPVTASTEPMQVATTASLSSLQHEQPSARGTPVDPDSADRTVRLEPGSQWVNVEYGESVKFIVASQGAPERSFAWRFDGSPITSEVDLSDVAPADVPVHGVRVFVAPDPRYSGE